MTKTSLSVNSRFGNAVHHTTRLLYSERKVWWVVVSEEIFPRNVQRMANKSEVTRSDDDRVLLFGIGQSETSFVLGVCVCVFLGKV